LCGHLGLEKKGKKYASLFHDLLSSKKLYIDMTGQRKRERERQRERERVEKTKRMMKGPTLSD